MTSLLNRNRPPVFCPGCSHERSVHALDQALQQLGRSGNQVAIVSDIGCSGLFDTFFDTHALHGLHGRALTYATGLKMASPELTVIVVMGDGGLGIGGAHVLSSCRRNLDLTLLVLNNFNYGMTGGQCSATTPAEARTSSGFLNQLEAPLDICTVAAAAGAPYVDRLLATNRDLSVRLARAIAFEGFSLLDIRGVCPGRFSKRNKLSLRQLEDDLQHLPPAPGVVAAHQRQEYGHSYRMLQAAVAPPTDLKGIEVSQTAQQSGLCSILLLGSAGQRITTAGELLCLAAMTAGRFVTQKSDYPITVLRGHSISEVLIDREPITYTGISRPDIVICLAEEGMKRRTGVFAGLTEQSLIVTVEGIDLPATPAQVFELPASRLGIGPGDQALASLALLCTRSAVLNEPMLREACSLRFHADQLTKAYAVIDTVLHA